MKTIKIKIKSSDAFASAQSRANDKVSGESTLVGWYDRSRHTGGPLEACGDQPLKTARDYARANGAEYNVSGGAYEFYFARVPADTEQLDPEVLVEIHRGLEYDRYENVQGG